MIISLLIIRELKKKASEKIETRVVRQILFRKSYRLTRFGKHSTIQI